MNGTPPNLQLLVIFSAVAELESFSQAARKLGIGKGTVSRSIAKLEGELGIELFHRTTHNVSLSTAGAALYERTATHLSALEAAVSELPELDEEPSGTLRFTAPPDLGVTLLPPILSSFTRRYPAVRFDIRLTGERIDLVKDGFDLALRVTTSKLDDSSLKVRVLGSGDLALYASPCYIARRGKPRQLQDPDHTWVLHPSIARHAGLDPASARFMVDDFFLARDLIREGAAIGLLPVIVARSYVREGLLEEVNVPTTFEGGPIVLLYPSSGHTAKKVSVFRDFLIKSFRDGL